MKSLMRLDEAGLKDRAMWEEKGYALPQYDREAVIAMTRENPYWVHFGAGGLFRALHAKVAQQLLNDGVEDRGIILAEGIDSELIGRASRPYDDYGILVTLKADGTMIKEVIGSVAESQMMFSEKADTVRQEFVKTRSMEAGQPQEMGDILELQQSLETTRSLETVKIQEAMRVRTGWQPLQNMGQSLEAQRQPEAIPPETVGTQAERQAESTRKDMEMNRPLQPPRRIPRRSYGFERMKYIFTKDSLQMATFAITEKAYRLTDAQGLYLPDVAADFATGPAHPASYLGKIAALLYARYRAGAKAIAMVSTDNCSRNGERLATAILAYAEAWGENGLADRGFAFYVRDKKRVTFPWTMVDKIVPRPDETVSHILGADGVGGMETFATEMGVCAAPFVNAEDFSCFVIEDSFPNGRPPLDAAGVIFTTQKKVEAVEKMKTCTCFAPIYTALAVFGCLLGYKKVSNEMRDPDLVRLAENVGRMEGMPVVANPQVVSPADYIDKVLHERLPNPFLPDTPQRIVTDTSQKLAARYGGTIRAYATLSEFSVSDLTAIPLVLAGWLRYLMGVDDHGRAFKISPDPMLATLVPRMAAFGLVPGQDVEGAIGDILRMKSVFGVDLYEVGLAVKVCMFLGEMTESPGAVRRTLKKYLD